MEVHHMLNLVDISPLRMRVAPAILLSLHDPPTTPTKNKSKPQLTRDQRIQVKTLRRFGCSYEEISRHLTSLGIKCSIRQAYYAEKHRDTPQKQRCRPKPLLNTPTRKRIVNFITSSRQRTLFYCSLVQWRCSLAKSSRFCAFFAEIGGFFLAFLR